MAGLAGPPPRPIGARFGQHASPPGTTGSTVRAAISAPHFATGAVARWRIGWLATVASGRIATSAVRSYFAAVRAGHSDYRFGLPPGS